MKKISLLLSLLCVIWIYAMNGNDSCPQPWASISETNFDGKDLSGCDLSMAMFDSYSNLSFKRANLKGTIFDSQYFENVDFSDAEMGTINIDGIPQTTSFSGTGLTNATFKNNNLSDSIFVFSILENTTFTNCNLDKATFNNSTFKNVSFNSSDNGKSSAQHADFGNAIILGTFSIKNSDFHNANFSQMAAEELQIIDSIIDNANFSRTPNNQHQFIKKLWIKNGSAQNLIFTNAVCGAYYDKNNNINYLEYGPIFDHTNLSSTSFVNAIMHKTFFSAPVFGANFTGSDLDDSVVDLNCYQTLNSLWFGTIENLDKKPSGKNFTSITSINPRGEVYTRTQVDNIKAKLRQST